MTATPPRNEGARRGGRGGPLIKSKPINSDIFKRNARMQSERLAHDSILWLRGTSQGVRNWGVPYTREEKNLMCVVDEYLSPGRARQDTFLIRGAAGSQPHRRVHIYPKLLTTVAPPVPATTESTYGVCPLNFCLYLRMLTWR